MIELSGGRTATRVTDPATRRLLPDVWMLRCSAGYYKIVQLDAGAAPMILNARWEAGRVRDLALVTRGADGWSTSHWMYHTVSITTVAHPSKAVALREARRIAAVIVAATA